MLLSSFLTLSLSSLCLEGCTPSSGDAELASPVESESSQSSWSEYDAILNIPRPKTTDPTDPTDPYFLARHGYGEWVDQSSTIIYSAHGPETRILLQIFFEVDKKAVTIYENNLHLETPNEKKLDIDQIFHCACLDQKMDFHETKWIDMFVNDEATSDVIQSYRKDKDVANDEIKVTPDHADWSIFSEISYYKDAVKMVPGAKIDKILIRKQEVLHEDDEYDVVISEVFSFSYKKELSQDGNMAVDSIDTDTTEVAAKDTVSASEKAIENEAKTGLENSPDGHPENTSEESDTDAPSKPAAISA